MLATLEFPPPFLFFLFFLLFPFGDTHPIGGKTDENAQSARELASKKSCVRLSCVRHRSDIELASVTGLRVYVVCGLFHITPPEPCQKVVM